MKNEERKINPHMQGTVTRESQSGGKHYGRGITEGIGKAKSTRRTDAYQKDIQEHYSVGGIEVRAVQRAKVPRQLTLLQAADWFNVVKYVLRCGWKGTLLKDLKKARDYLNWLIEDLENANTDT